jgi:hypothetical protein
MATAIVHLHRQTEAICAELGAELLRDYEPTIVACWRSEAAYADAYRAITSVIAAEAREILG